MISRRALIPRAQCFYDTTLERKGIDNKSTAPLRLNQSPTCPFDFTPVTGQRISLCSRGFDVAIKSVNSHSALSLEMDLTLAGKRRLSYADLALE